VQNIHVPNTTAAVAAADDAVKLAANRQRESDVDQMIRESVKASLNVVMFICVSKG